jgi:DNA-binding Lrp family transcriptional regulator
MLDATEFLLVNPWQRGFPLVPRPFEELGRKAGLSEADTLARLVSVREKGIIDRIGPVFRPNTVGASSLAAMAVPPERLAAVAAFVSGQRGVNHNYEREHRYNLWFVATGATQAEVQGTLSFIEDSSGLPLLRLPLVEEFHIDLGFDLDGRAAPRASPPRGLPELTAAERKLVAAVAAGLPLVAAPYEELARQLGSTQAEVISLLGKMLDDGRIRRIGAVIRHRRLGYQANAMTVWDLPDCAVSEIGRGLAAEAAVTLCYRRARALPEWPYNLYCMVHGRERNRGLDEVNRLSAAHGLEAYPRAILFSERCFSQRAAKYG